MNSTETRHTRQSRKRESSGASAGRGGRRMTPGSGGSKASTRPSVTVVIRLIQRICAAVIGRAKPNRMATITVSDLAAVGRQRPGDHLADVVVDRAALVHGGDDRGEVVVEQHHLGGLLGRLGALAPHGDADVGLLERRRVVDAVAGHRDDGAVGLQRAHDAQLVLGAGAGEHLGLRGQRPRARHRPACVELGAGDDVRRVGQAELAGDRGRGGGVVAGDHLHGDAGGAAFGDRRDRLVARRVDEADDAEEHETVIEIGEREPCLAGRGMLHARSRARARLPTRPARSARPSKPGPRAARRPPPAWTRTSPAAARARP